MKEENLRILIDKIETAKSIAVAGHKNPDGDSLCSVLALAHMIKINFNKNVVCLYDGNIPDMLDNVPLRDEIQYHANIDPANKFDLFFILDYGTKNHIGGVLPFFSEADFTVEIDHHKVDETIADLSFNDDKAASVGAIIFNIANTLKWERDKQINDLLALSILTDTGFFKYARTGKVFRYMASLVDDGVDIEALSNLLNNKPRKTVITEASVASRAEFLFNGRLALATIDSKEYKNIDGRGETVLSLLGQIKGVEYIALLKKQKDNQTGLSLRGKTKPVDGIASALGGGGHSYAAGAVVQDSLENVREKLLELFRREIR